MAGNLETDERRGGDRSDRVEQEPEERGMRSSASRSCRIPPERADREPHRQARHRSDPLEPPKPLVHQPT
jgi:hypothetical protein